MFLLYIFCFALSVCVFKIGRCFAEYAELKMEISFLKKSLYYQDLINEIKNVCDS